MAKAAKEVAKLAAQVSSSSGAQGKDMGEVAQLTEKLQLFTRQTAWALSEQTQAVDSLAEESSRQASSLKSVAATSQQQVSASGQLVSALSQVKIRLDELVRTNSEQAKSSTVLLDELRASAQQLARLRQLQTDQKHAVAELVEPGNGQG